MDLNITSYLDPSSPVFDVLAEAEKAEEGVLPPEQQRQSGGGGRTPRAATPSGGSRGLGRWWRQRYVQGLRQGGWRYEVGLNGSCWLEEPSDLRSCSWSAAYNPLH